MITNDNLLDNEREGAEIVLSMPIKFNKISDFKTVTEIQFRYRCYHFETMTSKKFRQGLAPTRAPKRTQKMCPTSPTRTQLLGYEWPVNSMSKYG